VSGGPVVTAPVRRRPLPPWIAALSALGAMGGIVAAVASQFAFDPVGRQIAWIGSSFTLTATCVAYVVQSGRRTAWDEERYEAARRRMHAGGDG